MREKSLAFTLLPPLGLLGLAAALGFVFAFLGRQQELKTRVPEFIGLALAAGVLYVVGVYLVQRFPLGAAELLIILGGAVLFRLQVLPAIPSLSDDVYRYQWDGRIQRAHINPYTVYPAMPDLARFQDPGHPIEAARTVSTIYPPLVEKTLSWVETVPGYKRLFTALDLASLGVLLILLAQSKQPLHHVLAYAWNPTVIVAFALCGHHDSLAVLTLLLANLFIIGHRPALSITSITLSILSKYFPGILLPLFLKRTRWAYAGIVGALALLVYLPFWRAGPRLFKGLSTYAASWESNDSLFRLIRLAGNSKSQAELIVGLILVGFLAYALKKQLKPLDASLLLIAALLLLSPNAFPWYFTWFIPYLCFRPSIPLLLMSVTAVLGYSPVVAYAAGQFYKDSPFILALEYLPVYLWLAYEGWRALKHSRG
jgi:uncharacterized membrane protein